MIFCTFLSSTHIYLVFSYTIASLGDCYGADFQILVIAKIMKIRYSNPLAMAGLNFQKKTVKEIVVLPMLRPDIFTGLRGPPKGDL